MTHDEYIKRRHIVKMTILDLAERYQANQITLGESSDESDKAIDQLVLDVIGEDEKCATIRGTDRDCLAIAKEHQAELGTVDDVNNWCVCGTKRENKLKENQRQIVKGKE